MNVFELEASITLDKSGFEVGLNEAKAAGESAGQSISSGFGGKLAAAGKIATTAASAVVAVGKAVYSAGKAFAGAVADVAEYGDSIDKASQRLGISATAYQEWEAVMQHSGTSMDSMAGAFKTLANAATDASADQAAAFGKLGMSLDSVKTMSQEDLFRNVIQNLGEMEEGTERTALAQDLLGRSAMELGPLLNSIGADPESLDNMIARFDQLGLLTEEDIAASARFQDSLQDMTTAISGVGNAVLVDFLPGMADIMDGITNIFAGDSGAESIAQGVQSMVQAFYENIPEFAEVGIEIVAGIAEGIIAAAPNILNGVSELWSTLYDTALEFAPTMEEAGYKLVEAIADGAPGAFTLVCGVINTLGATIFTIVSSFVSGMLQKGAELVGGVASGISGAVGQAVAAAVGVGNSIVNSIANFVVQMLSKGGELISNLASGISGAVSAVVGAINTIINGIKMPLNAVDLTSIGANIINGLWNGIKSKFETVITGITNFAGRVNAAFKAATQQASPSRLWRKYGQYLLEGLILGIGDLSGRAVERVQKLATSVNKAMSDGVQALQDQIDAIQAEQQRRADEKELKEREEKLAELYSKLAAATGDDIKKYEDEIAKLKAEYAEKDLQKQEAAQIKELQSAQDHLDDMQTAYEKAMNEIADTYDDTTKDISRKQSSMYSKLMDYGDLFTYSKTKRGDVMQLSNLDSDINNLQRYSDVINSLAEMGLPSSLMSEIMGLSIDDAIEYGGKLLNMGAGTLSGYIEKWNTREALASSISSGWYAGDMANAAAARNAAEARTNIEYGMQVAESVGASFASALTEQFAALIRAVQNDHVTINLDGAAIGAALLNPLNRAAHIKGVASIV